MSISPLYDSLKKDIDSRDLSLEHRDELVQNIKLLDEKGIPNCLFIDQNSTACFSLQSVGVYKCGCQNGKGKPLGFHTSPFP